jgi:hypothetical protein
MLRRCSSATGKRRTKNAAGYFGMCSNDLIKGGALRAPKKLQSRGPGHDTPPTCFESSSNLTLRHYIDFRGAGFDADTAAAVPALDEALKLGC